LVDGGEMADPTGDSFCSVQGPIVIHRVDLHRAADACARNPMSS
jgi:hypothetical protein